MSENAKDDSVSSEVGDKFKINDWLVDVRALEITNGGETRKLEPKVMDLLVCLANKPGQVMTREELEAQLWSDVYVGYDSLTKAVIKLRKAFGDESNHPTIIKTIPKVGYSLIADVQPAPSASGNNPEPAAAESVVRKKYAQTGWRTAIISAAVVLVLAVGGVFWWQPRTSDVAPARVERMAHPLPGKPSIAVLAFDNLSEDPAIELLSDAMADNIITELSRFSELFVIARNSSFAYKDRTVDVRQIAEELGVRYVLEGSLQKDEDRLRVSVQLIDALAGTHVWANRYDREVESIFAVQDEITRTVVATVARTVNVRERDRAARKHPANLAAYEYYLRGERLFEKGTKEGSEQAIPMFEKALELDPGLARAHMGQGKIYLNVYRWGFGPKLPREEALRRAIAATERAVELDPMDYMAHNLLAYIYLRAGDHEKALVGFEDALKRNPNADIVMANMGELHWYKGEPEQCITAIETAKRLNPHYPGWYNWNLSSCYYLTGKFDEALRVMNSWENRPIEANRALALIYVGLERMDEARRAVAEYMEVYPDFSLSWFRQYMAMAKTEQWVTDHVIEDLRKAGVPE